MKKSIVVILFSFFSFEVDAQTYPIPGATQQPAWVFPFFIEDAHGNKDTVYIGYDPVSSQCHCPGDDSIFGERWYRLDSLNFNAFTYASTDSVTKVEIKSDLGPNNFYFGVGALNAYYPVKFSWDVSLLRSDSIPFPDQDPLPRAQINLAWYSGANTLHTATCGDNPIVISDTVQAICSCQYRDSIVIYHFFNDTNKLDMGVDIQVTFWSGMNLIGVPEIYSLNNEMIYPVPVNDFLFIKINTTSVIYEILDTKGIVFKKGIIKSNDSKILVSDIPSGFYLIRIYDEKVIINKKIIIQH